MSEAAEEKEFERLLQFLRQNRGSDLTGYKRPSLMRRVSRRMQTIGVEGYERYVDYLEVHPEEFSQLFNVVLINVTSFFRDPPAWEYLQKSVLPDLLQAKGENGLVRVWCAGVASGQEAYSVAMAFAEAMGAEAFSARVKIYATDVDDEALNQARLGTFAPKEMEELDPALRERYFQPVNGRFAFHPALRRSLIFGRNDLVQDSPISRLDLLLCRNTLMYFNAEAQAGILSRFHFALNGSGVLFLGRAEMLLTHAHLFSPLDMKSRIFAKVASPDARHRPPELAADNGNGADMNHRERLRDQAMEDALIARIVVDTNGVIASANQRARVMFSLNARDVGRSLKDLEVSHRPVDLRALIEQAYAERRAVTQTSIERRFGGGEPQYLDIVVTPFVDEGNAPLGVGISFVDVTRYVRMQEELQRSREEIQSTNEELQSSNEELETTNEELQSSNEELETTNEELQSTNEELETMNEELQSTNEELQTVNAELRTRTEDLNELNGFFQSVLGSLSAGAVVVNHNLDVLMWNHRAEDLWGLRAEEVQGRGLLNLDIGLPLAELRTMIRPCLSGEAERQQVVLDAINRRGKPIKVRVTCTPLVAPGQKRQGVILMMEDM